MPAFDVFCLPILCMTLEFVALSKNYVEMKFNAEGVIFFDKTISNSSKIILFRNGTLFSLIERKEFFHFLFENNFQMKHYNNAF